MRTEGAEHQWRRDPPRRLSVDLVASSNIPLVAPSKKPRSPSAFCKARISSAAIGFLRINELKPGRVRVRSTRPSGSRSALISVKIQFANFELTRFSILRNSVSKLVGMILSNSVRAASIFSLILKKRWTRTRVSRPVRPVIGAQRTNCPGRKKGKV